MKRALEMGRETDGKKPVPIKVLKPAASVFFALLLSAFAIFPLIALRRPPLNPPQFKRIPLTVSTGNILTYDFSARRPFENGRMWIGALSGQTNWQMFVFDIENRRVIGQLTNGWPEMLFGNQLLCSQATPAVPNWRRLWQSFLRFLTGIIGKRIALKDTEACAYWLVDLQNDTANWLGNIAGTPGTEVPSPDFRYCLTARWGPPHPQHYLFDLDKKLIEKLDVPGYSAGWWDNTRVLFETTNSDFVLYDVRTKITAPLITFGKLGGFLEENELTLGTSRPRSFAIWNGREYDFYLTDTHKKWLAEESFLVKLERPDGRLKLLSSRFKFEWSDHFDPSARLYLYGGRTQGQGSDGVFLRHLETGTNQVLVAPTANKAHSIARFYDNSVIYLRSNALWRISLDGSNNVKLFPPDTRP